MTAAPLRQPAAAETARAAAPPVDRPPTVAARARDAVFAQGVVLQRAGDLPRAEAAYRAVLAEDPQHAGALCNLAEVRASAGTLAEAIALYESALEDAVGPAATLPLPWKRLAAFRDMTGRRDAAIAAWRCAVERAPEDDSAWVGLATSLRGAGHYGVAEQALARAAKVAPGNGWARVMAADLALQRGARAEAIALFDAAEAATPGAPQLAAARLMAAMLDPEIAAGALADRHRDAARRATAGVVPRSTWPQSRDPARRITVGYLSGDLRTHSVARFLASALDGRDRSATRVLLYKTDHRDDATTAALTTAADGLVSIASLDDAQAAARITADAVDILVDLSGWTQGGRPGVLARRPAPIGACWLGYPLGTGLDHEIRLTDAIVDPPDREAQTGERLLRLPAPFVCFRPSGEAPAPAAPPLSRGAPPTFGSFNTLAKLTDATLTLWSGALAAVPGSRLLLKAHGLSDPRVAEAQRARLAARGIAGDRVELLAFEPATADHLACYAHVDVALDPMPYAGTTTTCEALWQGVPVVTLPGGVPQSRVGASLLTAAGHPEWIARDPADFARIVEGLVRDPTRLARTRHEMRGRLATTPLFDAPRFAATLDGAWRGLWRAWCDLDPARAEET